MELKKIDVRRKVYSLKQHHANVLKKIAKMQAKSNTAGSLLKGEINAGSEGMILLFNLFLEFIQDTNEDKKYFLEKLHDMNEISKAMGDYLKELNEITIEVNNANKQDKNYSEATLVGNTIKRVDKMIKAVNNCNSILSSSQEERKKEAITQLRKLNTSVIQIKKKLQQKKTIDKSIHKPDFTRKKLDTKF